MHGKVRLTKRQMKEDKFTAFMLTSKSRIQQHMTEFAVGAVAVLVIVAAVWYFIDASASKQEAAETDLARAQLDYQNGYQLVAITSLGEILEEYDGTSAAERATFLLGRYNFNQKNFAESKRFYELYAKNYKDHPLKRAAAIAGIAAIFENTGDNEASAAKYDEAFSAYPDGPEAGDFQLGALRNYLAVGDQISAKARLDSIVELFPNTPVANRATMIFAEKGTISTP